MEEKKTFSAIYKALPPLKEKSPKMQFIERMSKLCMCSESTIRMWISGTQQPSLLAKKAISEELGVDINTLFPKKNK